MRGRWSKSSLLIVFALAVLLAAHEAAAQSAIAGVVRDSPVPSCRASPSKRPARFHRKIRTATTDGAGAYRAVDLRPGVYSVKFSLSGFAPCARQARTVR